MDLDDSFTERLVQRSKARREYINEKKTEFLSAGKKRAALTEEHQIKSDEPPNKSPKWQSSQTHQTAYSPHDKENVEMLNKDSNAAFVPFHSASNTKGLAALKRNFLNGDNEDSKSKTPSEPQEAPTSVTHPVKYVSETSGEKMKNSDFEQGPLDYDECSDNESIDENDFAENYSDIKSDHGSNIKMELDYSPAKEIKGHDKFCEPKKPEEAKKPLSSVVDKSSRANIDPAELPLSARKALFEKALLGGTPKINENVIDHKLSVAQRAAMFENASKVNSAPKSRNFNEPKRIAPSNFSKFDASANTPVAKSPIKIAQPVNVNPQVIKASPIKKIISSPVTSTPSPPKNVGNHTRFIQQKLIENSGSNWQEKEIVAKATQERKQEISSLVNHWEKLSSSSAENNSEMEKNHLTEECISYESDIQEESEHDEKSDCYVNNDVHYVDNEVDDVNNETDDVNNETDDVDNEVGDVDKEIHEEEEGDSYDEESDMAGNVFYAQKAGTECLELVGENNGEEQTLHGREDSPSSASQNTGSIMSSLSNSDISSYSDNSSYNASGSISCTSGSSVRSLEFFKEKPESNIESKNPEVPLLYTVSFYRKQKQETRLTPVRTIVRREEVCSPESPETDYREVLQERIKALQEEILRQQTVISQTSQALNLCSATAEFSGSTEQVEGERLLLIATQKRQACLNEINRLKTCGAQGENVVDGKGTLTINDLKLPLKREFIATQLEGKDRDTVHYFLCLIRHGAQVIVTQMMSTDDKTDGALCFTNHIQLRNLPPDFSVIFEVYALQTKKEVLPHEKKYHIKREHSKIRLTPKGKKSDGKILMPAISSPGGPNAVRSPSFGVVGYTRFTIHSCSKRTFTLDKVPFTSPLEGVLRVNLQLHVEHKVMEKGFLTMFEDVSGFGAWYRRWCALDASRLTYWKYPGDEETKEPIGVIDLKQCVTGQVKLVPRDVCARPQTFQLVIVRPQEKGDKNTLISRSVNTLTTTKHLLSADTKEERILWCNKLNEALSNLRRWDLQALRPVEAPQD